MPAGLTYDSITSQTITGTTTYSFTLNNIPQTYTDLVMVCNMYWSQQDAVALRFNNDSGSNYGAQILTIDVNNTTASDAYANISYIPVFRLGTNDPNPPFTATPFGFGTHIFEINNYRNTSSFKASLMRNNNYSRPPYGVGITAGLWRSTSAISRIDIIGDGVSYIMPGSTISLYGITAA